MASIVLTVFGLTTLVVVTYGIVYISPMIAAVFCGLLALVLLVHARGLRILPIAIAIPALIFAPMIGLRVGSEATIGDALLVIAVLFAVSTVPRVVRMPPSWRGIACAAGLAVLGGIVGTVINAPDSMASAVNVATYAVAAATALAFAYLMRPTRKELRILIASYGLGTSISAVVAIATPISQFRPVGLANHPNHLGISCLFGAGLLLSLVISDTSRLMRMFALVGMLISGYGVVVSGSRSALVGLVAVIVFVVLGSRSGKVVGAITVMSGSLLVLVLSGTVRLSSGDALARLLGEGDASEADVGRAIRYATALGRIQQNPIAGNGFGDVLFGHSLYLQLWDGAGILGLVSAVIFVVTSIRSWFLARKRHDLLSVGVWATYLGYLVACILSNQMWDRYIWIALGIAIMTDIAGKKPWVRDDGDLLGSTADAGDNASVRH